MTQLDLLAGLPVPRPRTLDDDVAAAHAFLDELLERRVCRGCCRGADEVALTFVHLERRRTDVAVRRLAAIGVSRARLVDELAKCGVWCRGCHLARSYKLLRAPARALGRGSSETAKAGIRNRMMRISA